jgi:uncharacterized alkaline shock family protein YloU
MTKDKQAQVTGSLVVSNGVIADLIGYAALESYGVVGMAAASTRDRIAKLLPMSRLRRGVVVHSGEGGISVELYVVIEHGTNLATVSQNLANRIRFVLENFAALTVDDIAIHVQGVHVQ